MAFEDVLEPATADRLRAALHGGDVAKRLELGALEVGAVGIVEASVAQAESPRTFTRRDGREGTMARVVLRDGSGEAVLVLWGEQTGLVGTSLLPGAQVRITGVCVRAGYRGLQPELAFSGDVLPLEADEGEQRLEGTLALGPTEPVLDGDRTRFRADGVLAVQDGTLRVLLWDEAVAAARRLPPHVRLTAMAPHPALDGFWISTPRTEVLPLADPATVK